MSDLLLVFRQAAAWVGQFLSTFTSNWFTQILLFLFVLSFIVNLLLIWRGDR